MTLDTSGNLGLGVTPSAWQSGAYIVQQNSLMAFASGSSEANVLHNAFYNNNQWEYISTSFASRYQQNAGSHAWYTAASGTAGNAITFTQAMTLTAAGKLGIGGSTAPDFNLSIGADFFGLNFGSNRLSLIQTNSASHSVALSSIGDSVIEASTGGSGNGFIEFRTLNTERARVSVDGYLRMASGTGGIQFNGDTAAANALDDYEEGTWTPAWSVASGTISTNANASGRYRKIGNAVFVWGFISSESLSSPVGAVEITGLPFTSANGFGQANNQGGGVKVTVGVFWGANMPEAGNIYAGGTTILPVRVGATSAVQTVGSDFDPTANFNQIAFSGQYMTA
jgi:hypothetical protein